MQAHGQKIYKSLKSTMVQLGENRVKTTGNAMEPTSDKEQKIGHVRKCFINIINVAISMF